MLQFILTTLFLLIFLFAPSYIALRYLRIDRVVSLGLSPVISMFIYPALGMLYSFINIPSSSFSIILPFAIILLAFFMKKILKRDSRKTDITQNNRRHVDKKAALNLLIYIACGMAVGSYVFLQPHAGSELAVQSYDNIYHYNLIRHYMNSNDWSVLHASLYPIGSTNAQYPISGINSGSYYPSGWHLICVIAMQITTCSLQTAVISSIFVFSSIVFPVGVWSFLSTLFGKQSSAVTCGALVASCFACFPWGLTTYYPLFPNLVSMTLAPATASAFISTFQCASPQKKRALNLVIITCIAIATSFFVHPNTVFTLIVLLTPFYIFKTFQTTKDRFFCKKHNTLIAMSISVLSFLFICLIWCIAYKMPFMQNTVHYDWPPIASPIDEALGIITLNYIGMAPQLLLATIVGIGVVFIFIKMPKTSWIVFSYIISLIILFTTTTFEYCTFRQVLGGFWYTDCHRIAAMSSICAMPIAAIGLNCFYLYIIKIAKCFRANCTDFLTKTCNYAVILVFAIAVFYPESFEGNNGAFNKLYQKGLERNNPANMFYSIAEQKFIETAKTTISQDALIMNNPFDGSALSFAFNDLNTYFRDVGERTIENSDPIEEIIQEKSIEYILTLGKSTQFNQFNQSYWQPIENLVDADNGFSLILESNEMKLYKVNLDSVTEN